MLSWGGQRSTLLPLEISHQALVPCSGEEPVGRAIAAPSPGTSFWAREGQCIGKGGWPWTRGREAAQETTREESQEPPVASWSEEGTREGPVLTGQGSLFFPTCRTLSMEPYGDVELIPLLAFPACFTRED